MALIRFANGGMGKVSGCVSMWMPYNFNIDLLGTDGSVRGNRFFTRRLPGLRGMGELPKPSCRTTATSPTTRFRARLPTSSTASCRAGSRT